MYRRPSSHYSCLLLAIVVLFITGCPQPQRNSSPIDSPSSKQSSQEQQPLVVFIVRHAEKVDNSRDANLSPAGETRADSLAVVLRDCDIDQIHSSDFARTRDTAAPTARKLNLEVQLYDADNPSPMVEQLRFGGGRHLVVGHSNTVPNMVELLGGDAGPEIGESEYDRLFIIMIGGDGETTTVPMRY